ncbi:hypothetical protein DXG01_009686 [Tephrocybe rancida]|nr:hypothetical protein DXG01_009686 [Tephrocybe rancida]
MVMEELRRTVFVFPEDSVQTLLDGVDTRTVDFGPVFGLAADLYTHIGLAFMNSVDHPSRKFFSPIPTLSFNIPTRKSPKHRDEVLKVLALKRDVSEEPFYGLGGVEPILTHVIPSSINSKPETMNYISIIAGNAAKNRILRLSHTIDNVLAMEESVATSHRLNCWGLEACERPGKSSPASYYFKTFEPEHEHRAGSVFLRDGDEILFGQGPEGAQHRNGPNPLLCNLRLAVGRALHTSGAAEFISELMDDADDIDCPHEAVKDKDFHEVLSAKLLICGRAQMV